MKSFELEVPLLPKGWDNLGTPTVAKALEAPVGHQLAFRRRDGLFVIMDETMKGDGQRWRHISISRKDRLPSWFDLKDVKNLFIGRDKQAMQILPPEDEFVNINPNVLHLWYCIEKRIVPDMTMGSGSI